MGRDDGGVVTVNPDLSRGRSWRRLEGEGERLPLAAGSPERPDRRVVSPLVRGIGAPDCETRSRTLDRDRGPPARPGLRVDWLRRVAMILTAASLLVQTELAYE